MSGQGCVRNARRVFGVSDFTAEAGAIAAQSVFLAAGWSGELDPPQDDVQTAIEVAGESDVKLAGTVASPRGF